MINARVKAEKVKEGPGGGIRITAKAFLYSLPLILRAKIPIFWCPHLPFLYQRAVRPPGI